jgi:ribosomal protein S18 acetylase RimI-like enzyme
VLVDRAIAVLPCAAGDLGFLARLAHEAFDEYTPRAVSHTLEIAQRAEVHVAWLGERRVGFFAAGAGAHGVWVLQAIAVDERERGRGVGRELMVAFERLARERGLTRLELCTADSNLAALDLFRRRGFRLVRRHPRFYERGQAACVLVKDLPPVQ